MGRSRWILLISTLVTYVLPVLALGYVWLEIFNAFDNEDMPAATLLAQSLWKLGGFLGVTGLAVMALMTVYLRHIFRNANLDANWKAVWTLGIVFLQLPVMIVYWVFHIERR